MARRAPRARLELPDDEQLVLARARRRMCVFCGSPAIGWDGISGAIFAASSPAQRRAFMEALEAGAGPSWPAWWCTVAGCDGVGFSKPSFWLLL